MFRSHLFDSPFVFGLGVFFHRTVSKTVIGDKVGHALSLIVLWT